MYGGEYGGQKAWKVVSVTCMSVVPTDLRFFFKSSVKSIKMYSR